MRKRFLLLGLSLILVAAACNKNNQSSQNPPANDQNSNSDQSMGQPNQPMPVTVTMAAQNGSKETGTATLTAVGPQTQVKIDLDNGVTTAQPAHIHMGACPNPGIVEYPLTNVVSGKSTTVLDVSLTDLLAKLPLAINVHKSATEVSTYVSCGDIKQAETSSDNSSNATVIKITADGFSPSQITVKLGTTVTFQNTDTSGHWPASNPHPTHTDYPQFDAKHVINPGESWSFTFDKVGTWGFHDHRNPSHHGTIIVTE